MLKVELHTHTADDPRDAIPYTSAELIDRAVTTARAAAPPPESALLTDVYVSY